MDNKIAKAGTLLCLDEGGYSSYCVVGFFVVLKDFSPMEKLEKYLKSNPEQKEHYRFESDAFLAGLLKEGLLVEVTYGTLHLGDYSTAESVDFTPRGYSIT